MRALLIQADARHIPLKDGTVHCCVTSPPYWNLRDYGVSGQIGLEKTPEEYVAKMVQVFREVWRVLRDDGTLWLNLGDSYAGSWKNQGRKPERGTQRAIHGPMIQSFEGHPAPEHNAGVVPPGLKAKDMVGVPWRVAFALQADGWYLRSDIIYSKPSPMPESVPDRPTKAHEYLFLMAKSGRYYYDAKAIEEPMTSSSIRRLQQPNFDQQTGGPKDYGATGVNPNRSARRTVVNLKDRMPEPQVGQTPEQYAALTGRNRRTVWTIHSEPYSGAHFAVMPTKLVEPCVLAGCPSGGIVLDPFAGSGTVGEVSSTLGRRSVLLDLSPAYIDLMKKRTAQSGMFLG